jgi:hypothetical protein
MEKDNYLTERLESQIEWYDTKSETNQFWFKSLRATEIICAAAIPFIAGFSDSILYGQVIIGVLGVIIAICAGLSALNKYQENWLTYRTTCETLRHEKYLFLTGCKPYDGEGTFNQFVERVESLISIQNSKWSHFTNKKNT